MKSSVFLKGMRDGVPIGLGYFAVAFALGIAAKQAGLTALQGFITSLINAASAGEYAGFRVIAQRAPYLLMFGITLVVNARYFLMSCAVSQRFAPGTPLYKRLAVGFCMTDEIFGISIAREGYLDEKYPLGAMSVACPLWATGTAAGIVAGNLLPAGIVSAMSVMLYAMFICIVVPPAKQDRNVRITVLISLALSFAASVLPGIRTLSEGGRTLLLTVGISAAAALLLPVKEAQRDE